MPKSAQAVRDLRGKDGLRSQPPGQLATCGLNVQNRRNEHFPDMSTAPGACPSTCASDQLLPKSVRYCVRFSIRSDEYRERIRHGTGTFTYGQNGSTASSCTWVKPGDVYHGPFVTGKMHGIGQWTHAKDGTTERVEFRNHAHVGWPDRD